MQDLAAGRRFQAARAYHVLDGDGDAQQRRHITSCKARVGCGRLFQGHFVGDGQVALDIVVNRDDAVQHCLSRLYACYLAAPQGIAKLGQGQLG